MNALKRVRYLCEYGVAQAGLMLARSLPLESALRAGELAGRMFGAVVPRRMRIAVENIRAAFPEMTEEEVHLLARRVFEHMGRASVESAFALRLLGPSTWADHVVVRNKERFREVDAERKGGILVTGHIGVWEVLGIVVRYFVPRLYSIYRPAKNPYVDGMVRRQRTALGQEMIERDGALMKLLRILRRGGYIGLLVDQHAKADGVWVPFFGRPASTTPGPALLALRTGAPIITGYAVRLPGTYRFEVFCDELIYAADFAHGRDRSEAVREITLEISRRIERYVRMHPEQWLWMHRRWRRPPPGIG